jgi:predicted GNAT superfamily acetyltransferase
VNGQYDIRPFRTVEDYKECVDLQEETWGHGFSERVPTAILKVSQMLGGVAAGAYDGDGALVGFVYGMTGVRDGEVVHWSDMLAVTRGLRDTGLGRTLKAHQREVLLKRDITTMYWTFDPLQSRNAYLNFSRLGIVAQEYACDMYGQTDSPLHRGIGTDRLIALWLMDSERVRRRVEGEERGPVSGTESSAPAALEARVVAGMPEPGESDLDLDAERIRVAIPGDISDVMARSMDAAVTWRASTREVLSHYMSRGYEVRELLRRDLSSDYLLVRGPEA